MPSAVSHTGVFVGVEEMQNASLHGGAAGRQLHPDEKGPAGVSVSTAPGRRGGGGGDGEATWCRPLVNVA